MESNPPLMPKNICRMVRLLFLLLQKGVTKSKIMLDLHLLMKRGKILRKAMGDLMLRHHSVLSCRSHDSHMSFVSPREYEFSCSNSPAYQSYIPFHVSKRRGHHPRTLSHAPPTYKDDEAAAAAAATAVSPLVGPVTRVVRITDSPFPLKGGDEDCHVDKAAEEFIERFYKELRLQKMDKLIK